MLHIVLGLIAGAALGALYFGGLWLTIKDVAEAKYAAARILGSFVLRGAIVLGGFYLVLQLGLPALAAAMVAFLAVRIVSTRVVRPNSQQQNEPQRR